MPKIRIWSDEQYPVFGYSFSSGWKGFYQPEIETDQATLDRWDRVTKEYDAIQHEMADIFYKAKETPDEERPDQG